MKLEQSFEVDAPLERVWEALIDVERVAPCLPGAEVTGKNDDGSYDGTFKVKIGPTAASYAGKLHMDEVDAGSHTATMHAQGTDRRGQGGAKATIVSSVAEIGPGSTRVQVVTDYHITGRLARFGRGGMIEEISNRLLGEFAKSLQAMLAAGDGSPAAAAAVESAIAAEPTVGDTSGAGNGPAAPSGGAAADEPAPVAPDADAPASPAAAAADGVPTSPAADSATPPPAAPAAPAAGAGAAAGAGQAASAAPPPPPRPAGVPAGGSEPMQGLSLVGSVMWTRLKRNPAPVVGLVLGFLAALRVLRRRG